MFLSKVFAINFAQLVYSGKFHPVAVGLVTNKTTGSRVEKFTLLIEQFQGIPLFWVVTGCKNNTSIGSRHPYRQLGGRRGSQTDIEHIETQTHQGSRDQLKKHFARDAGIASHNYFSGLPVGILTNPARISSRKPNDIKRIQAILRRSSYHTPDTRNRFN